MEVEMKIRGLMMDPVTNMPIVVLKDVTGDAVLPIWVGIYEANAIALEIEKVTTPRPMTHDLIKNVLTGLGTQVHKIVVSELREDTFFAVIWLERDGRIISIDSRPSDALALALRMDCPIFVADEVLKSSKLASAASDRVSAEELRKWLENLNDEDLRLVSVDPAHTDGDIYVFFPQQNVLVAGDVLSVGQYPILDYVTGGWIGGLQNANQALLKIVNADDA